ncbi:MAG TPA: hypothetical protein VMV15_05410 [Candidatus Binataceae bacterium]|nr:hypothetical protein [Candidatus Binataceae bacterium]
MATSAYAGLGGVPGGNGRPLFEFGLLGSGALTSSCDSQAGTCSSSLEALVNGNVIRKGATFTDSMTWSLSSEIASAGQSCFVATGTGSIVTRRGDQINYLFNGLLCGNSETFIPSSLNATYVVSGGTGRFANSVGSGNFTQNNFMVGSVPVDHQKPGATVTNGPAGIVRFDGLLTARRFSSAR